MSELQSGWNLVRTPLAIIEREERETKVGKPFLVLRLGDRTGQCGAVMWDPTKGDFEVARAGAVVNIWGTVGVFRGEIQVTVKQIEPNTELPPELFVEGEDLVELDEMWAELVGIVSEHCASSLSKLVLAVLSRFEQELRSKPAGKKIHHTGAGGLLRHTLNTVRIGRAIAEVVAAAYPGLHINDGLVVAACALHDAGKAIEFELRGAAFEYSADGQLLGHIILVLQALDEEAGKAGLADEGWYPQLKHAILAHHGARDRGAPVEPRTVEAMLVCAADSVDSRVGIVEQALRSRVSGDGQWTEAIWALDGARVMRPAVVTWAEGRPVVAGGGDE